MDKVWKEFEWLKKNCNYKPELPALTALMEVAALQKSAKCANQLLNGYLKNLAVPMDNRISKFYKAAITTSGLPSNEIKSLLKDFDQFVYSTSLKPGNN